MPRGSGGNVAGFKLLSTPNAPTIDSVSTGIGSASVSFTAPADTGDAAISSYVVTAVNESTGVSTAASGTESPISVSPGIGTFKIRMQAQNAYGPGRLTEYDTGNTISYSSLALFSWGNNYNGQLGINSRVSRSSPTQVSTGVIWTNVRGTYNHFVATRQDGTLWSWGVNNQGQLGTNNRINRSSPVQIGALTTWAYPGAGGSFSAGIKTDGTLWTWGYNGSFGKLGLNDTFTARSSPTQVGALTNWVSVSLSNQNFVLALKTDGTLWAWGQNSFGAVGDNTTVNKSSPVQVGALTNWYQLSAGNEASFAVKTDNTIWAWGRNQQGALGQNNIDSKSSPTQIGSLTNWESISAGHDGAVAAIKTNNTLWAWGHNDRGQLGLNDLSNRSSPVQVGALSTWSSVVFGGTHCAARKTDGTLWTWGSNGQGRLGQGDTVYRSSPTQVGALTTWISPQALTADVSVAFLGVV